MILIPNFWALVLIQSINNKINNKTQVMRMTWRAEEIEELEIKQNDRKTGERLHHPKGAWS